ALRLGWHARRARVAPVGHLDLPDRLGAPSQFGPDAQPLEQSAAAMGQGGGAVVIARLPAALCRRLRLDQPNGPTGRPGAVLQPQRDRKSTRLNSSHVKISYAVF